MRPSTPARPARGTAAFIAAFVLFDLVNLFVPALDQRLRAYPFSSFPVFAQVRAARPWSEHLPYIVPGDHFVTEHGPNSLIDHKHRRTFNITAPDVLEAHLRRIREVYGVRSLRHSLALYVAPAYPAPARFAKTPIAITGELDERGFRTLLGTVAPTRITLAPRGLDASAARLAYYTEASATRIDLPATREGDTFHVILPAEAITVVALLGEDAWLVGHTKPRR